MSQPPSGQSYPPPAGQPAPPAPPAAKKRKKWPFVLGAIILLIVIIAVANGGTQSQNPPAAPAGGTTAAPAVEQPPVEQKADKRVVVYEVTGAGSANSITYTTDGMTSTEQVGQVPLPWSKTIELPVGEALQMVSVLAQAGDGTPEISAKITVDGKVVKEGKSSGQFAVVTVNENIGSLG